jgi:hypothetical protein
MVTFLILHIYSQRYRIYKERIPTTPSHNGVITSIQQALIMGDYDMHKLNMLIFSCLTPTVVCYIKIRKVKV